MDRRVIFLIFVLNIVYVSSSPRMAHVINKREIFCGQKLTDALALLCKGNYNGPSKKSLDGFAYGEYEDFFIPETYEDGQIDFPFMQKEVANSFTSLRRKKGIINECCRKPCSYKHLSLYCA